MLFFVQAIQILKYHIWFLGGVYSNLSQYYDFFFSSIGLLCGGILFFQGWRLDPILLLSQILLSGTTIFFIVENIYLRNSSHYSRYTKRMGIDSEVRTKCTYKNLKLESKVSINKKKLERVSYTKHVSYYRKYRNKKALNYLLNSTTSYFE